MVQDGAWQGLQAQRVPWNFHRLRVRNTGCHLLEAVGGWNWGKEYLAVISVPSIVSTSKYLLGISGWANHSSVCFMGKDIEEAWNLSSGLKWNHNQKTWCEPHSILPVRVDSAHPISPKKKEVACRNLNTDPPRADLTLRGDKDFLVKQWDLVS